MTTVVIITFVQLAVVYTDKPSTLKKINLIRLYIWHLYVATEQTH